MAAEGRRLAAVAALSRRVAVEAAEDRRWAVAVAAADHPAGRQVGAAAAVDRRPRRRQAGVEVAVAHRLRPAAAVAEPAVLHSAVVAAEPPGCVSDTPPCRNVPTVYIFTPGGDKDWKAYVEAGERNQPWLDHDQDRVTVYTLWNRFWDINFVNTCGAR